MLVFHQSTMRVVLRLIICFYICSVVIVQSLHNTFLIHTMNSLHWCPSGCIENNYKIGLLGKFGRMLFCELCFSHIAL